MLKFTEKQVKEFFDKTLKFYLSFWDPKGSVHVGYFDRGNTNNFMKASNRINEIFAEKGAINSKSYILDVGCGCGNTLIWLAKKFHCRGEGIDISGERINFAKDLLKRENKNLKRNGLPQLKLKFREGSGSNLPYKSNTFTHVISQDALFAIPNKPKNHKEMFRVLKKSGLLVFDDFLQPKKKVSRETRKYVYDRVMWNYGYSLIEYQNALTKARFRILYAEELPKHIKQTYFVLGKIALEKSKKRDDKELKKKLEGFSEACKQIVKAVEKDEFSWGMFVALKQ